MNPPQHRLMADISDFQASFIARRYARAGRRVVMIKASEGAGLVGASHHEDRARAAHRCGLIVIHYSMAVFADPPDMSIDALTQSAKAAWCPGDRLLIDVEDFSGSPTIAPEWMKEAQHALLAKEREALGRGALGYTNEAYMAEGGRELCATAPAWLIAAYDGLLLGPGEPRLPGRATLLGKQYTDGSVGAEPHVSPGVSSPCDDSILTPEGIKLLGLGTSKKKLPRRSRLRRSI